ncbi:MAB_1171c family putative transporter [Kribbella sp. GL6]|uniref:MAB_1171c family putative transporter n=1 Tax=Kribbella sp. GL6 TaxID=3419765 RepID=UPI003D079D0D
MIAAYLAGAAAFCLLIYRFARSGYPGVRYTWCLSACLATGMALTTPGAVELLDRGHSVPMLTTLASDCLKISALGFLVLFLGALRGATRRHGAVLVMTLVVVVAEVVLFLLAAPRPVGGDLVVAPGRTGVFTAYLAVFVASGLAGLLVFTVAIGATVRRVSGPLRVGLILTTAGGVTGICWVVWTVSDIVALVRDGRIVLAEDAISAVLGVTAIGLSAVGATVGLWHSSLAALGRARRARREYARLEPLWLLVSSAAPGVVLEPGLRVRFRNAEFALYRRIIEIRDGYLALRDHIPLTVADPTPAGEAGMLVAAAEASRTGRRYRPPDQHSPSDHRPPRRSDATATAETAWLGQVSDAIRILSPARASQPTARTGSSPHQQA